MKLWMVCGIFSLSVLPQKISAQVYAPETEFHDKVQRLFIVEATRVLAWRENLTGQKISEITYKVNAADSGTNRITTWDLNLLNDQSNSIKMIRVSYPITLLSEGPRFYRETFKQIWSQGQWAGLTNLTADELNHCYWQGAELNGMAREVGIRAAFDLAGAKPSLAESESAPKLAGLLVHVPLPSLCGGLTLDAMLLARGAAWLALSESMLKDSASTADENWAPIIFMAGRENLACQLWKDKVQAGKKSVNQATLFQWWNFFLKRPHARKAFEFIVDAQQRRFGMPMITYYSRLDYLGSPLIEVLNQLYGTDQQTFVSLYNYGGFLAASTDVGGGRLLEGAWPAIFRSEWLKLLKDYPMSSLDYSGYVDKVKSLSLPDPLAQPDADDASLTSLKQAAPLLELGYEQGTGKLTPVSSVTARDLLNYGWEMNALQMGARYYFVDQIWSIPDLAETILKRATLNIEGQMPFFPNEKMQAQDFNLQATLYRLQMVDDLGWRVKINIQPFAKDTTDTNGARQFYRRCWLRPYETRLQAWALCKANLCGEMNVVLRRYHNEGGPKADMLALEWIQDWYSAKDLEMQPELKSLQEEMAEGMGDPTITQVKALYQKRYASLGNAARAEAYEKLFWQNPDCGLEQDILNGYIFGGAWKSAIRFYKQARETVSRDVGFSNFLTPQVWMMGFLDNDDDLMNLAFEDSDTGSYSSMITAVWHYTAHDQFDKVEQQLSELISRYESEWGPRSLGRTMKGFLPLIPALKDPKHPRHEETLDYFGKSDMAEIFRWILIRKYKLNSQDAIRFLGGKETDRLRRVLVLYLENERGQPIRDALTDYIANNPGNKGAGRPLACWAAGQTQNRPKEIVELDEKDLKPADALSIRQAVLAKLHQN
jgi:hypothetical protein